MLIDIHGHRLRIKPGEKQILAVAASFSPDFHETLHSYPDDVLLSVGVHPWDAMSWDSNSRPLLKTIFLDPKTSLIGEIGLDKASSVPLDIQISVFEAQVQMAEEVGKPVVLHIVRAMSELLAIRKKYLKIPAWIIHGFRGGKQEAEQYIRKGFYLSFGPRFNREGLFACPVDRLFLETDDGGEELRRVYEQVAHVLQCPFEELEEQVENNFRAVLGKSKGC